MADPFDESFEMVGKILAHLLKTGLLQLDLEAERVIEGYKNDDSNEAYRIRDLFCSVMHWLINEGLITGYGSPYYTFGGVQLTAKGIVALQSPKFDPVKAMSAASVVADKGEDLSGETYSKIGSFIGGLIGGLSQSVG